LWIKYTQLYSNSFTFDIFIARCLGGKFFTGHNVVIWQIIMYSHMTEATDISSREAKQK